VETPRPLRCPECGHELSTFEAPDPTEGERAAARVADVIASWAFPTLVLIAVVAWGLINVAARPIEPYPVVVLAWISAVLATVAACQGPLILLAQRRAALQDRARDEEAFRVATHNESDLHRLNRRVEDLHVKLDTLTSASRS